MPKISKNIKKLRAEKNLTQDALAEKIHVTRQAISNWENDKTKPDIEALESLAQAFEVDIEELIYGEKKVLVVSQDKTKEKNRIKIILAIVGSLFVASGLALVFFGFWQDFALPLQTVFSLVPMLLGQCFAIYTYLKKKDSIPWRESAGIIWTVGVVATIALLNGIYNISLGYINCLVIDAFLILPIMFLLNSVSPLAFFLYSAVHIGSDGLWQYLVISLVIYAVAIIFTAVLVRRNDDVRASFAQWITVVTSVPLIWIYNFALSEADIIINSTNMFIAVYLVAFLCLYVFSSEKLSYSLPYKPISLIGMCVTASLLSATFYNKYFTDDNTIILIVNCIFCVVVPLIAVFIKRKSFQNNINKILISSISFVIMIINFAIMLISEFSDSFNTVAFSVEKSLEAVIGIAVVVFGVVLVYTGIKELRLFHVNLGLFTAFFQIVRLLYSDIVPDSYFLKGVILVIFGVSIIIINSKMLSIKRIQQKQQERGAEND